MQKLITTLFALSFALSMGAEQTPSQVYSTQYGKKYHTHKDCRYLKGKDIKTETLEQAKKNGKTLCKTCENKSKSKEEKK